jgi:hypothetical protein
VDEKELKKSVERGKEVHQVRIETGKSQIFVYDKKAAVSGYETGQTETQETGGTRKLAAAVPVHVHEVNGQKYTVKDLLDGYFVPIGSRHMQPFTLAVKKTYCSVTKDDLNGITIVDSNETPDYMYPAVKKWWRICEITSGNGSGKVAFGAGTTEYDSPVRGWVTESKDDSPLDEKFSKHYFLSHRGPFYNIILVSITPLHLEPALIISPAPYDH